MWVVALVAIFGVCTSTGYEDPNDQTVKLEVEINPEQPTKNDSRIVGGEVAERHAYPWQVRMGLILPDDDGNLVGKGQCGGTIICATFIMTAAHCLECSRNCDRVGPIFRPGQISVLAGAQNVKGYPGPNYVFERGATNHKVSRVLIHPQHRREGTLYDFAILQLQDPILFWEGARPLYLPETNDDKILAIKNSPLAVSGWGATQNQFQDPNILRVVSIRYIPTAKCPIESFKNRRMYRPGICAGIPNPRDPDQGKDACFGDSGGPLAWVDQSTGDLPVKLLGLVSGGVPEFNNPKGKCRGATIYANLCKVVGWINDNTGSCNYYTCGAKECMTVGELKPQALRMLI